MDYNDWANKNYSTIFPTPEGYKVPSSCCKSFEKLFGNKIDNNVNDCRKYPGREAYQASMNGCLSSFQATLERHQNSIGIATTTVIVFMVSYIMIRMCILSSWFTYDFDGTLYARQQQQQHILSSLSIFSSLTWLLYSALVCASIQIQNINMFELTMNELDGRMQHHHHHHGVFKIYCHETHISTLTLSVTITHIGHIGYSITDYENKHMVLNDDAII